MSTSFPFLKIAREFGVPYGDVIRGAEHYEWCLDHQFPASIITEANDFTEQVSVQIIAAVIREKARRGR